MATAFTNVYKYRDPEKIDLSSTFQAQSYKQQNYDINTTQTQQLINQYAGTDLLRDIDKEYFGERLNTLVGFINQSGTRDWSRKSISNELQNYVSTALDKNVMSAIASTHSFRKQQAEIEDIKKNKPDQYSMQNEWFATQDLQRYLKSNEIGDSYRAQPYVPYTDVKDFILKNTKVLKDFGIEYSQPVIGGNGYFRMIGQRERLSPETVKQFLGGVMDSKIMNQLYIDGQYAYKNMDEKDIDLKYDTTINNLVSAYDDKISQNKILLKSATKSEKSQYETTIKNLESQKNDILIQKDKIKTREGKSDYMYRENFENQWTNFLSYDYIKDWKMDNSMFEIKKMETDTHFKGLNYNLEVDKMKQKDEHLEIEMRSKGLKAYGTLDPNNPLNANDITLTDDISKLNEEKADNFTKSEAVANSDYANAKKMIDDNPNFNIQDGDGRTKEQILGLMINTPSAAEKYLKQLSPGELEIVNKARYSKKIIEDMKKPISDNVAILNKIAYAMMSKNTKESSKNGFRTMIGGNTLDNNGNIVKGDVLQGEGKFQKEARIIAGINSHIAGGNVSKDDITAYRREIQERLLRAGMSAEKITTTINTLFNKEEFHTKVNREVAGGGEVVYVKEKRQYRNLLLGDLGGKNMFGEEDIDTSRLGDLKLNSLNETLQQNQNVFKQKIVENQKTIIPKNINIQVGSKTWDSISPKMMALLPLGTVLEKGSNVKIQIDHETGMANIQGVFKNESNKYVTGNIGSISMKELPSVLLNSASFRQSNPMYSASNKNAIAFELNTELPDNLSEVIEMSNNMSPSEQQQLRINPPTTKEDIQEKIFKSYNNEVIENHRDELTKLFNSDLTIKTVPTKDLNGNDVWAIQVDQKGIDKPIYQQLTDSDEYSPDLMLKASNKIITSAIEEKVAKILQSDIKGGRKNGFFKPSDY